MLLFSDIKSHTISGLLRNFLKILYKSFASTMLSAYGKLNMEIGSRRRARELVVVISFVTVELLGWWTRLSTCKPAISPAPTAGNSPLPAWAVTNWTDSHATFYGGHNAEGTMGGACGYWNTYSQGYGVSTAAVSDTLFNKGLTCGACFELKCNRDAERGSRWCYQDTNSIVITATNSCPPNWDRPTDSGGWCNPPRTHFDLSFPTFMRLAVPVAGIVEVSYRRVSCSRQGGVRFTIMGNTWFNLVLVHNVGDAGDVELLKIKGSRTEEWLSMNHNWGQIWAIQEALFNQSLSFRVTISNGKTMEACEVAPSNWQFGQTFETVKNF